MLRTSTARLARPLPAHAHRAFCRVGAAPAAPTSPVSPADSATPSASNGPTAPSSAGPASSPTSAAGAAPPASAAAPPTPPSADAPSSPLTDIILDHIKTTGPISLATYMQLALSHPVHGYYTSPAHAVLGAAGDFTTSPEISQVFGELLAIWLAAQWRAATAPAPALRIIELGPGRGTLMADILNTLAALAPTAPPPAVHLVETSPPMRARQAAALAHARARPPAWYDALAAVPPAAPHEFTALVAHEFFDALPVHALARTAAGWHELRVAAAPPGAAAPAPFVRVRAPAPSARAAVLAASSPRFARLPPGARLEVSPAAYTAARAVGGALGGPAGGAALVVDYGAAHAFGDSFRAFRRHARADPLAAPGTADLTANVDFAYLREALAGAARGRARVHGPLAQGAFLARMGLALRVARLAAGAPARAGAVRAAAARLVDGAGMGREYAVLGVTVGVRGAGEGEGGGEGEGEGGGGEVWPFVELGDGVGTA